MTDLGETLLGLFTEIAIIEHLARTRLERKVNAGEVKGMLKAGHFGVLNYFIRNHPAPDTIGGIAWSFQEDEAYTTSKIAELEELGLISVTPPGGRDFSAEVFVTDAGRRAQADQLDKMAPEFVPLVAEIDHADLETTTRTLREIRLTLDNLPDR